MQFKKWLEVQWSTPWPNRKGTGDDPHDQDAPPNLTSAGDYVLYQGTNMTNAKKILAQRTIQFDDIGSVGVTTTPRAAGVFAAMKASARNDEPSVVLQLVVDKDWFLKQDISREVGGGGKDQWLLKAEIPSSAIKQIKIYSVWGTPVENSSGAERYFGIGHGDYDDEYGYEPSYYVWVYEGNGAIDSSEKGIIDPETGEADIGTHGSLWGHVMCDARFKGRYEPETGRLSIAKPCRNTERWGNMDAVIRSEVIPALEKHFETKMDRRKIEVF